MSASNELLRDLQAERADVFALLARAGPEVWDQPTPAHGWSIRHQIAHLATFDDMAATAITDPQRFAKERAHQQSLPAGQYSEDRMAPLLALNVEQLAAAWTCAADAFDGAVEGAVEAARVPWYGPDMSVKSMITARIMETWAHGQDIEDTGIGTRVPTDRLRHVAFLGVRTMSFSYRIHGRPVPTTPVRIELVAPSGDHWRFGDDAATEFVCGSARDFALVVTRRRHLADTDLQVSGATASDWLVIAQSYAGAPGPGRRPGQFSTR